MYYMQNAAPSCNVLLCSQNVACSLSEERFCAAVLQFIAGALTVPVHACEASWPVAHSRLAGLFARVQQPLISIQHIHGRVRLWLVILWSVLCQRLPAFAC